MNSWACFAESRLDVERLLDSNAQTAELTGILPDPADYDRQTRIRPDMVGATIHIRREARFPLKWNLDGSSGSNHIPITHFAVSPAG